VTDWSEYQNSKTVEDRVVSVVYHQTVDPQPETVSEETVLTVLADHDNEEVADVRDALDRVVESGRVVECDGQYRLADDEPRPGP